MRVTAIAPSPIPALPNLLLIGLAAVGLVVGWKRSAAVLICAALFALFPLVCSSSAKAGRIHREIARRPSFAVCLLAVMEPVPGEKTVRAWKRVPSASRLQCAFLSAIIASAAFVVLFVPAIISAATVPGRTGLGALRQSYKISCFRDEAEMPPSAPMA